MKRKIIQLAEDTLVVSLPSQWVRKYGMVKGDELEVTEEHAQLILKAKDDIAVAKSTTVDVSGLSEEFVKSIVSILHKVGYDEFELLFDKDSIGKAIERRAEELVGFEVVEKTANRCLFRNVGVDSAQELDSMIRRTFLITVSLSRLAQEYALSPSREKLDEILSLEKANNRLTNYCHRLLNKSSKGASTMFTYTILWLLEKVADQYRDLSMAGASKISAQTSSMMGDVGAHLENVYAYYYDESFERMDALRAENARLRKLLLDSKGDDLVRMHLFALTQSIYECFGSTTGMKFLELHK